MKILLAEKGKNLISALLLVLNSIKNTEIKEIGLILNVDRIDNLHEELVKERPDILIINGGFVDQITVKSVLVLQKLYPAMKILILSIDPIMERKYSEAGIDDFNNNRILKEKIINSMLLEQNYQEFKLSLENIKPPLTALKANRAAIESVSYNVLFFKKFNENAPIEELNLIENQAYLAEVSFWDEIDRIYEHFDKEINMQDIGHDFKYSANTVFNKV